jgi:4-hydroxy-4-methyl-2-oxoglutarate aldolase
MIQNEEFAKLEEKLYSAVITDILDELGVRNNAMHYSIKPIDPKMVVIGRAFTVLATDIYQEPEKPYELEIEAVDSTSKGEVVVATTNGSISSGFWGELLTTGAKGHGCRGAIIDGLTRDQKKILEMDFPLFVKGSSPYDSKGRTEVIAYQVPVVCGNVLVNPGDIVFGDVDGITVVPKEMEDKVFKKALEKVSAENKFREELLAGASVREVFDKYHFL